jgi:hypothetical protein
MSDPGKGFAFFRQYALCGYAIETRPATAEQKSARAAPSIVVTLPAIFGDLELEPTPCEFYEHIP